MKYLEELGKLRFDSITIGALGSECYQTLACSKGLWGIYLESNLKDLDTIINRYIIGFNSENEELILQELVQDDNPFFFSGTIEVEDYDTIVQEILSTEDSFSQEYWLTSKGLVINSDFCNVVCVLRDFLFSICANSQLREITAWAFNSSIELVALISEEITLFKYSSTNTILITVSFLSSTIIFNVPVNLWFCFCSQ